MTKTFGKVLASSLAVILAMSGTSFAAPDNALIMAGENGMAVTTQPLADMAGQLILDSGGMLLTLP